MKNEFRCRNSKDTKPQIAAKIPINKCRNGQHQVNFVIYSIDVNTLIGNIVENVKSPKRDLHNHSSSILETHPAINPANISLIIGGKP